MPLSGSTYVAPTWRNGGPPALDAAELQAISDTLVRNQTQGDTQQGAIAALQSAVSGLQTEKAQIQIGSYVGTGTYGASNRNSITCSFMPKLVIISVNANQIGDYSGAHNPIFTIWVPTNRVAGNNLDGDVTYKGVYMSLSGLIVRWYSETSDYVQLNHANITYRYVIIG